MAYFITNDNSTKGRDPKINIINGIHSIKGKTSVNILVSNYTNKHITFNKGEYIGHLESVITDNMTIDQPETHSANSVTLQKMMAEQVQPDISTNHIISQSQALNQNWMHSSRSMNPNLPWMRGPSEQHY